MSLSDNGRDISTTRRSGGRVVAFGLAAIVGILAIAAVLLFMNLPTATAFVDRVDRIFLEYDLTSPDSSAETTLLGILAESGAAFSEVLASYRVIIFVLLIFATALLIAALVFLVTIATLNRRIAQFERSGLQVSSLVISRAENKVYLNDNLEFTLTGAVIETLGDVPGLLVLNKADLRNEWELDVEALGEPVQVTSAKTGAGVDDLFTRLADLMVGGGAQ